MSLRFKALNNITYNNTFTTVEASAKVTAIFCQNVFTLKTARAFLSEEAYKSLAASSKGGPGCAAAGAQ